MAAYFIVNVEIPNQDDRENYDTYIKKVKPIVESYGGKYLVRSEEITLLSGDKKPDRIIVIAFETRGQLEACFAAPAYTAIKDLREMSVKTTAVIVEQ